MLLLLLWLTHRRIKSLLLLLLLRWRRLIGLLRVVLARENLDILLDDKRRLELLVLHDLNVIVKYC